MESRKTRKAYRENKNFTSSGLSDGVANATTNQMDKGDNKLWEFLTSTFLFLLGGIILCGMLYALITFT